MAKFRVWIALVLSVVAKLVSGSLEEEQDCMTTLIELADIRPTNRNFTVYAFHRNELDQKIIYDMSRFADVQDLLSSAGISNLRDKTQLFKCLNKEYRESDVACFRSSPCGHGVCAFDGGRYVCHCDPGYTGSKCKRELNECDLLHPCLNGGTCNNHVTNFTCSCMEGFYGWRCETDRHECASSPCRHGSCTDIIDGFQCDCEPGYMGKVCDEDLDECASSPCQHGTCRDHLNKYSCDCQAGYKGTNCDVDIDECSSQPCQNQATCHDKVNNFTCECSPGYDGRLCNNDVDECASFPCQHGTCQDHLNKYSCDCQAGYKGYNCHVDIDECSSQPCQNQATCHDKVNNFTCQCPLGYDGQLCGNQWWTRKVFTQMQASLEELVTRSTAAYTRWGRTVCPDNATLVYNGYVLGSLAVHNGGGANPLCLHSSPRYARYADFANGAILYPAVYQTQDQNKPYSSSFQGKLAPCVVCAARQKTMTVIIPATNDCPADWSLEYHGYLLASHYNTDKRSQYLCFDDAIESVSQHSVTNTHNLYRVAVNGFTEVYTQNRELTCVVCSK